MNLIKIITLTIISSIVSILFSIFGMGLFFAESIPMLIMLFALLTLLFGLSNLGILILAWKKQSIPVKKLSGYLAIGYLILFTIGSFDHGMISGHEVIGILFVGIILLVNWLSLKSIARYRKSPNKYEETNTLP